MSANFMTIDELGNLNEIINTLNDMSIEAQKMVGEFKLYDVNGEVLGSIGWENDQFVVYLGGCDG